MRGLSTALESRVLHQAFPCHPAFGFKEIGFAAHFTEDQGYENRVFAEQLSPRESYPSALADSQQRAAPLEPAGVGGRKRSWTSCETVAVLEWATAGSRWIGGDRPLCL